MKKGIITLFALFLSTLSFTQTVISLNLPSPCAISINNNVEICSGDSVFAESAWQTNSGFYYDTLVSSQGYDSIIVTNLTVFPNYNEVQSVILCLGDSILLAGEYQSETGSYTDSLSSINGCDSIVITNLTVHLSYQNVQAISICQGDSVLLAGEYQFVMGSYIDSLTSINGCDSILITNLTVFPSYYDLQSISLCEGDSVLIFGEYQNETGIYFDSLFSLNGCDSIFEIDLTVFPNYNEVQSVILCQGDSIFLEGEYQSETGSYIDNLTSINGCDSIIITNLTVFPSYNDVQAISICQGDSVLLDGEYQTETGSYIDSLASINGCDSILITELTVFPKYNDFQSISKCQGDSVLLAGEYQFVTGSYIDSLISINGCDSILITELTVFPSYYNVQAISICQGDSIFLEGEYQTEAGNYIDSLTSINGCDSIQITELSVFPKYNDVQAISICQGNSVLLASEYQFETGSYIDSLISINGCDSIIITNLTVFPNYNEVQSVIICQGDSVFLAGEYQTETGSYIDSLTSINGCDSILITELTVFPKYNDVQAISICQGDSIFLEGEYQTENGSYIDSLTSINGCDSILITELTVFPSYIDIQAISICQGDSVLLAGEYRYETGSYVVSLSSINGCDSILITNLTVFPSYYNVQAISICEGDSVLIFGEYQNETGFYLDSLFSLNGCDSIFEIDLTVFPNYNVIQSVILCQGDSIFLDGEYQTETGSYIDSLASINSCDSIIITNLTVFSIPLINLGYDTVICDNESIILSTIGVFQTYQWSNGTTNQILEVDTNSFNYGENIIYLTVIDSNNCGASDTVNVTIEICSFISNSEEMLSIEVFPNPASNNLTVLIKSGIEKIQTVEIIKIDGDIIKQETLKNQNKLKYNFNVNNLASGIYFIKVSAENNVYTKKLVIK